MQEKDEIRLCKVPCMQNAETNICCYDCPKFRDCDEACNSPCYQASGKELEEWRLP